MDLLRTQVQVDIFDDRSGTLQQLRVDCRHDRRHRRSEEDPGGKGRQHFDHQGRDHQIRYRQVGDHRPAQRAREMHPEHEDRDHHGADNNPPVHCLAVLIGDAAHGGVR